MLPEPPIANSAELLPAPLCTLPKLRALPLKIWALALCPLLWLLSSPIWLCPLLWLPSNLVRLPFPRDLAAIFLFFSSTRRTRRSSTTQHSGHALMRTFHPLPNIFFLRSRIWGWTLHRPLES